MTDRELLELAAKAAGVGLVWERNSVTDDIYPVHAEEGFCWDALHDDGDALRIGAAIGMNLYINKAYCLAEIISDSEEPAITAKEACDGDTLKALRRAIVRAAAEIGKASSNVELTGAARLYRAASRERSERG